MKRSFLIVFYGFYFSLLAGSDIYFNHLTIENGLPSGIVNDMVEDPFGFIWIATEEGVCRFDGSDVKTFNRKGLENNFLMNSYVRQIEIGNDTSVWMVTNDALLKFDIVTEEMATYFHEPDNENSLAFGKIKSVYMSQYGGAWVIHEKKMSYIAPGGDEISRFDFPEQIISVFEDNQGVLWLLMDGKIVRRIDKKGGELPVIKSFQDELYTEVPFEGGAGNPGGGVWIFDEYIYYLNGGSGIEAIESFDLGLKNDQVSEIVFLESDQMLISTNHGGLIIIDPVQGKIVKTIVHVPGDEHSLLGNEVLDILQDKKGRLWVIADNCLHEFNKDRQDFTRYLPGKDEKGTPGKLEYKAMNDNVMVAGSNGVNYIITSNGIGFFNPELVKFEFTRMEGESLQTCLLKDSHGDIWFGTNDGVFIMDKRSGSWTRHTNIFGDDPFTRVYSMYMIDSVHFLIGSSRLHFVRYNRDARSLSNIARFAPPGFGQPPHIAGWVPGDIMEDSRGHLLMGLQKTISSVHKDSLLSMDFDFTHWHELTSPFLRVWTIFEESPGIYWVGFSNGLMKIDLEKNTKKEYLNNPNDPKSLGGNSVKSIIKDKEGNIWIATEGGGLSRYNAEEDNFINYRKEDGLPSNTLYKMLLDKDGNIWISSNMGLCKFDVNAGRFTNYTVKDGIGDNRFSVFGAFKDQSTGELYFTNRKGYIQFAPESITPLNIDPAIYITDLVLNGESVYPGETRYDRNVLDKAIFLVDKIKLSYKENNIQFRFAALDFSAPEGVRYSYKVEGFMEEWVEADNQSNSVSFFNLPPGKYKLIIKATNSDGIWASKPCHLDVTVIPPFWQTIWFRLLVILLIVLSGALFYLIRTQQLKRRNIELELKVQQRTVEIAMKKEELEVQTEQLAETNATKDKLFSIIAHDLRNPIHAMSSLHNILVKDMKNKVSDKVFGLLVTLNNSSGSLANLLENLLNWSRSQRESISINKQAINVNDLVVKTSNLLMGNLDQKKIELSNQCDPRQYVLADGNMMLTVVRNLISNAIKFTPKGGKITVKTLHDGNNLIIKVADTGIGMSQQQVKGLFQVRKSGNTTAGTEGEQGTGLGLLICKDFVEKNDGELQVSSQPGKGTEFSIVLPLLSQSSDAELYTQVELGSGKAESEPETGDVEKVKILDERELSQVLVVDDNKALLDACDNILSPNFNIILAKNGEEGWKKAKELIPDLIITDLVMPKLNGFELVEKLRLEPATSHIPVIMLTAESGKKRVIEGYQKEVDDYIIKPFNPEILIVRIQNLLKIREKLKVAFNSAPGTALDNDLLKDTDKQVFKKIKELIVRNLKNPDFHYDQIGNEIGMSRAALYKKIKAITGMSVNQFIVFVRLNESVRYLSGTNMNISEIAYKVGFNDSAYFTRCFTKQFNESPTRYREKHRS